MALVTSADLHQGARAHTCLCAIERCSPPHAPRLPPPCRPARSDLFQLVASSTSTTGQQEQEDVDLARCALLLQVSAAA